MNWSQSVEGMGEGEMFQAVEQYLQNPRGKKEHQEGDGK